VEARRPRGPSVREAAARDLALAGGQDAPIEIVHYDPEWPTRFASERERLLPLPTGAEIHHIGSTAVPGMPAKPVIDLLRASATLRDEYARLKRELAERIGDDREAYSEAKSAFIDRVEADARHVYKEMERNP
jgi:GrpB-like predicted nucleotidyltransferase (UPF0157 family)